MQKPEQHIIDIYLPFKVKIHSMLSDITDEEMEVCCELFRSKKVKKKTIVSKPGLPASELYFVLKGCLRLYYIVEGIEKTVFFAFENQFTGPCRSFMLDEPNTQIFEALEDTELLAVSRSEFMNALRQYPHLCLLRTMIAEENLFTTEGIVTYLLLNSPEERYIYLLKNYPKLIERVPLHIIASFMGISPVSLSRIRKRILTRL